MASRKTRALIAKQTVEIVARGRYQLPDGEWVWIGDDVRRAIAGTRHYAPEDFEDVFEQRGRILAKLDSANAPGTKYRVGNTTTLAAARELVEGDPAERVLCLNFASAKNPGGGFLGGSQAQEESLARASALYACINPQQAYYETNRACGTCLYTDHMIYSPAVPVFRDDEDGLLPASYNASFITSPAVNAGAVQRNQSHDVAKIPSVMLGRIEGVLSLAVVHGYRTLVLGAWGCGVFRNDPAKVAEWFHQVLHEDGTFRGAFDTVLFAVLDGTKDERILGCFQQQFGGRG